MKQLNLFDDQTDNCVKHQFDRIEFLQSIRDSPIEGFLQAVQASIFPNDEEMDYCRTVILLRAEQLFGMVQTDEPLDFRSCPIAWLESRQNGKWAVWLATDKRSRQNCLAVGNAPDEAKIYYYLWLTEELENKAKSSQVVAPSRRLESVEASCAPSCALKDIEKHKEADRQETEVEQQRLVRLHQSWDALMERKASQPPRIVSDPISCSDINIGDCLQITFADGRKLILTVEEKEFLTIFASEPGSNRFMFLECGLTSWVIRGKGEKIQLEVL